MNLKEALDKYVPSRKMKWAVLRTYKENSEVINNLYLPEEHTALQVLDFLRKCEKVKYEPERIKTTVLIVYEDDSWVEKPIDKRQWIMREDFPPILLRQSPKMEKLSEI